jgi:hypothetical protein
MEQCPRPPFSRPLDMVSAQPIELIQYIYELPRPIPLAHPVLFGKAGRIVDGTRYRDHDGGNGAAFGTRCKATRYCRGHFSRRSAERRRMRPEPSDHSPGAPIGSVRVAARHPRDSAGFLLLTTVGKGIVYSRGQGLPRNSAVSRWGKSPSFPLYKRGRL